MEIIKLVLGFIVVVMILCMIAFLLYRSQATVTPELLGAIIGYLFGETRIIITNFFKNSESQPDR